MPDHEPIDEIEYGGKGEIPGCVNIVLILVSLYFLKWAGIGFLFARNLFLGAAALTAIFFVAIHRALKMKLLPLWVYGFSFALIGWLCATAAFRIPAASGCGGVQVMLAPESCPPYPDGGRCSFRDFNPYDAALDPEHNRLFVTLALRRHVLMRMDMAGGGIKTLEIPDDAEAQRLIFDNDGLLYAGGNKFKIYVIDPDEMMVKDWIPINSRFASDFALDPDTGKIYAAVMDNSICILDPKIIEPDCRRVDTWMTTYDIDIDPERGVGYITTWIPGRVYKFDLRTTEILAHTNLSLSALGIKVDRRRKLVYVASPFSGKIRVLDADTLEPLRTLPAGFGARDIQLSPDGKYLVSGNYFARTVTLTDTGTGKIVWKKFVGGQVRGVNLLVDGNRIKIFAVSHCGLFTEVVTP